MPSGPPASPCRGSVSSRRACSKWTVTHRCDAPGFPPCASAAELRIVERARPLCSPALWWTPPGNRCDSCGDSRSNQAQWTDRSRHRSHRTGIGDHSNGRMKCQWATFRARAALPGKKEAARRGGPRVHGGRTGLRRLRSRRGKDEAVGRRPVGGRGPVSRGCDHTLRHARSWVDGRRHDSHERHGRESQGRERQGGDGQDRKRQGQEGRGVERQGLEWGRLEWGLVAEGLAELGGYCDCEVVMNCDPEEVFG